MKDSFKNGWITRKRNGNSTPWNKGIPHSDETKAKIKEKRKNQVYTEETRRKLREARKGRKFTQATLEKMSKSRRGNKCYAWRGGITSLYKAIRDSYKYRQWRSDCFTRDDFTCRICFRRGYMLQVDHIKSFAKVIDENSLKTVEESFECEELWNINNGRTLCIECHRKTETWGSGSRISFLNKK